MTLIKSTNDSSILKEKVKLLIEEVNTTHRYSMSRIYGLYNEVFAVAEVPQSCASCLIQKVNQLKSWLATQPEEEEKEENVSPKIETKMLKKGKK